MSSEITNGWAFRGSIAHLLQIFSQYKTYTDILIGRVMRTLEVFMHENQRLKEELQLRDKEIEENKSRLEHARISVRQATDFVLEAKRDKERADALERD